MLSEKNMNRLYGFAFSVLASLIWAGIIQEGHFFPSYWYAFAIFLMVLGTGYLIGQAFSSEIEDNKETPESEN